MPESPISGEVHVSVGETSTEKLIDAVVDAFSPATEILGALGDSVRLARVEIAARITKRAKSIADDNGLVLKAPPLKFLVPFFERASIEDEGGDEIEELWANLLVSAASDYSTIISSYVGILSSLCRDEALLLSHLFSAASYGRVEKISALEVSEYTDEVVWSNIFQNEEFNSDTLPKLISEYLDVPGCLLWYAGFDDIESKEYGIDSGNRIINLPDEISKTDYVYSLISLLVSKGLLKEYNFETMGVVNNLKVLLFAATPLSIDFMDHVQPGEH